MSEVNSISINSFKSSSSVSLVASIPFLRSLILSLFKSKPITFLVNSALVLRHIFVFANSKAKR